MPTSLHDVYRSILRAADEARTGHLLKYAAGYARHGLNLPDAATREQLPNVSGPNGEARVQALYVRSNLSSWRGPEAVAARDDLDRLLGKKS